EQHAQAERQRRERKKRQVSSSAEGATTASSLSQPARGHTAKKFLPGRSAIGPAATSLPEIPPAPTPATVATTALEPCGVSRIANVSIGPAEGTRVG
ncbi:MAG: hypothetical protein AAB403_02515, partial [Planctomycetota bacterium]